MVIKKHTHYINICLHLETSIRNPTGVGGKERPDLNMFPHVDFFRLFFWGTRLYIDTSHAKRNSVAIFSRSSHKCPRLSLEITTDL